MKNTTKGILYGIFFGVLFTVLLIVIMNVRCWDKGCSYSIDKTLLFFPRGDYCSSGSTYTSYCSIWFYVPLAIYGLIGAIIGYFISKSKNK